GHRRYSRYQLRIAARARELVDQGTPIDAACRIVILEDQLEEAQRLNEALRHSRHRDRATA
ncbi:MerR family transcriptional regulator, partial [Streptomyces sp. NPDC005476]